MDNRAAGATAAYLMGQWLGDRPGNVLITLSRGFFRGEEEREVGFRNAMRSRHPDRGLVEIDNTDGLDETMRGLVLSALDADPQIAATYSIGGGNVAIVEAFAIKRRTCAVFIAHDLDQNNTQLLRDGRISAVLHHDLNQDMRRACHVIMQAHKALPGGIYTWPSNIHVITPYNMPAPAIPER
jgi:LacI family transcriptional regulator